MLGGEGFDIGPGHSQQRPQEGDIGKIGVRNKAGGPHAGNAAEARAPQKVEEEGLGVVVGVVRHGDGLVAVLAAELPEPAVPQAPGGHLYGDTLGRCICLCVKALYVDGNAVFPGPAAHEGFVRVALFPAQPEVTVCNGKRPAFETDLPGQAHGIDASADGDKQHSPVR